MFKNKLDFGYICLESTKYCKEDMNHLLFLVPYVFQTHASWNNAQFYLAKQESTISLGTKLKYTTF